MTEDKGEKLVSIKEMKQKYGPNWLEKLKNVPQGSERVKRDKKKAKAARKARKQNRR